MSDFLRINAKRIDKIRELIQLINKSAGSQKPSAEEILMLCGPVYADLEEMGGTPPAAPEPGEAEVVSSPPVTAEPNPPTTGEPNPPATAQQAIAFVRGLSTRCQLDLIAVLATDLEYKLWEKDQ